MMCNSALLWGQSTAIGLHLDLIWGTLIYYRFLQLHQCPSRFPTVFLGTLLSNNMQIKAPYVFDGERGISLHAVQRNWASSHGEGRFSLFFLSSCGNLGYILELWLG